MADKPQAFLHYIKWTKTWIAYDARGEVVAEHASRDEVIRRCVALFGY